MFVSESAMEASAAADAGSGAPSFIRDTACSDAFAQESASSSFSTLMCVPPSVRHYVQVTRVWQESISRRSASLPASRVVICLDTQDVADARLTVYEPVRLVSTRSSAGDQP